MHNLLEIIRTLDSEKPNLNPTEVYNEGWMTRLLVHESIKEKIKLKDIDFKSISYWTSEALISSPFLKADPFREGYTHADMALGDFSVDFNKRGEIIVSKRAEIFGIIEAKMGSNLSQGTKHFENYNQASRNLACIAFNTCDSNCEIFFYVVAPENKISKHEIKKQIDLQTMINQIIFRFKEYSDEFKINFKMDSIISKASKCKVESISYEEWIGKIADADSRKFLDEFYKKAIKWNRIV